jgi:hypothetical protein
MFLKWYHHLHPMIESIGRGDETIDEDCSWDLFQQTVSIANQQRNLSLGNYWFSDTAKWIPWTSCVLFNGEENMKPYFLHLVFWPIKILCIVQPQIETERIFSLVDILINLRRCHL